jgi:hypothetical protein
VLRVAPDFFGLECPSAAGTRIAKQQPNTHVIVHLAPLDFYNRPKIFATTADHHGGQHIQSTFTAMLRFDNSTKWDIWGQKEGGVA